MQKQKPPAPFESKQIQDDKKLKPVEVPDIHAVMKATGLECVRDKTAREKAKNTAATSQSDAERGRRVICCCRAPGCRIGPMIYED